MKTENNVSIYAGKFRCADCGRTMSKTTSRGTVYYKCNTYKTLGVSLCSSHSIRADTLNNVVIEALRKEAQKSLNNQDVERLVKLSKGFSVNDNKQDVLRLESKLQNIANFKKKAYEDYAVGLLSKEDYVHHKVGWDNEECAIKKASLS